MNNNDSVVRFPTMLRVLLVEPDDSTRYIISALLRKCGYKVAAVRDGLKAWETLKNKSLHIDLLLTEVDLPNSELSGFSLLTSIMEHHPNCKNIPVIMMSSHDSVSTVFKCMLNGAVDFLIKPVRRNELRNLWQHVWRRHTISKPPQNSTTFPHNNKFDVASENNDATNNSTGSVASMQSEKTSEAQDMSLLKSSSSLSCTDKVKLENCTKFETEFAECNDETGGLRLGQSCDHSETENQDEVLRTELSKANPYINTNIRRFNDEIEEHSAGAIDLIATFENLPKSSYANCSFNGGNMEKFDFDTPLELSLQRDLPGSSPKPSTQEKQILNQSYASTFSWYGSSNLLEQPLFPTHNSHESHILSENTNTTHQYEGKNQKQESITYLMIGQSGQVDAKFLNSQLGVFPATGATSDHKSMGHRSAFDSMFYAQSGMTPKSVYQKESSPFPMSTSSQSNPKSQNSDDATYTNDQNVNDQRNIDCAIHDSPSNGQSCDNSFYHDGENHNTSGVCEEGLGSGSDGNASSAVVDKNNLESSSSNDHYDGLRGTNSHRTSEREAALTKFRLKRKDRCFEKKVRYESRKRQADKRPRVKGQFVRHVQSELPVADTRGY